MRSWGTRQSLLVLAAALAAVATLLAVTDGVRVTVGGLHISATSPTAPATSSGLAIAAWWLTAWRARRIARDLDDAWRLIERNAPLAISGIAIVSTMVAVWFGTYSASGSDASGYLSQAMMWASGKTEWSDTLASLAGWPARFSISAPLGWRPALVAGAQVPTYAPGLPLLMAIPHAIRGADGACLVVALSAGAAVWATGTLAARIFDRTAGVLAALLLATTPVFLYQSVQPMSDVPVTAAWIGCWAMLASLPGGRITTGGGLATGGAGLTGGSILPGRACTAGVACALAVLIRPNLAPLAAVPLAALVFAPRTPAPPHHRTTAVIAFAIPVALAGLVLAFLQWHWYGSPLQSGYGSANDLFAVANVRPNLFRYVAWLLATSPILALAPIGIVLSRRSTLTWALTVFAATVTASYLAYYVFNDWSYLRFLLPSLAVAAVFVGGAVVAVLSRMPSAARPGVFAAVALTLLAQGVSQARARHTFDLEEQQRGIAVLGPTLRASLPSSAVIVSGEQSGSLRYYTQHAIVRWDDATPEEMRQALDALEAGGHEVWVALDSWEEPLVRQKFASLPLGALDWPPAVEAGDTHRIRVWRLADRAKFLSGQRTTTERLH